MNEIRPPVNEPGSERQPGTGPGRALLIGLGVLLAGIGTVGIFVPGLPTTIFLLGASACFARSSPKLQKRLTEHPRLGPYLRDAKRRRMRRRDKVVSLALMWSGVLLSQAAFARVSRGLQVLVLVLGLIGTGVILFWIRTSPPVAAGSRGYR